MTRRLRLHRIAQTYLTMYLAGISIFRNQKKPLFSSDGQDPAPISPSFYSSREIKEKGQEFAQSRGTRSVGALFSSEQTFLVFNGDFKTSSYRVELRMKSVASYWVKIWNWPIKSYLNQRGLRETICFWTVTFPTSTSQLTIHLVKRCCGYWLAQKKGNG